MEVVNSIRLGFSVLVESGAGLAANISDEAYKEAGAEIVDDAKTLWKSADIVMKVRAPERHPELALDEIELLSEGGCLISFIWPAQNEQLMQDLAAKNVTVLAMDSVPRMSRAQKLDALSSMANIAGYRAIIEAAQYILAVFLPGRLPLPVKFLLPRCWSSVPVWPVLRRSVLQKAWVLLSGLLIPGPK